jgi:hypothetical protein
MFMHICIRNCTYRVNLKNCLLCTLTCRLDSNFMKKSWNINWLWKHAASQPELATRKNKTVGSGKETFEFRGLRNAGCVKLRGVNCHNFFCLPNIAWVMESRRMGDVRQRGGVGWQTRSRCRWQVHLWKPFCDVTDSSRGPSRGRVGGAVDSAVTGSRVEGAGKWIF